ncbi:hypothetical protein Tco_1491320 [Tanacetum coccineum]
MAEQDVPAQPPTRTDEQIVPRSQWLTIGKSNLLFNAQKIQKNPIFQISVDILSNTNFFQAFTASANVPAIYLQQFWKTMSYNEKTGVYSCQLDEQWFDLSADLLRKALAITPVNPAHPFELPPSGDTVIDFVNELGYPEPVEIVSSIRTNYVYQPWRAILCLLNQCLTGKTSGSDKPRHPVLQILWGIVTQTNVDHAELIWEEFTQGIQTFFLTQSKPQSASMKNQRERTLSHPYMTMDRSYHALALIKAFATRSGKVGGLSIGDPGVSIPVSVPEKDHEALAGPDPEPMNEDQIWITIWKIKCAREESGSTIPDPSHQTGTSSPPVIPPFTEIPSSKPLSWVSLHQSTLKEWQKLEQEMSEVFVLVEEDDLSADVVDFIDTMLSSSHDLEADMTTKTTYQHSTIPCSHGSFLIADEDVMVKDVADKVNKERRSDSALQAVSFNSPPKKMMSKVQRNQGNLMHLALQTNIQISPQQVTKSRRIWHYPYQAHSRLVLPRLRREEVVPSLWDESELEYDIKCRAWRLDEVVQRMTREDSKDLITVSRKIPIRRIYRRYRKDGDGDGNSQPHKGVKASANSDVKYSFTSAQDGEPLQDDVRLCLGNDLKKAQDLSQRGHV